MIRGVHAYHNLLVFEKGDNREPSTGSFDPGNPHVTAALAVMEHVLLTTPTAEGLAQLARTYSLARQDEKAVETIERGLARWPEAVHLLLAGEKIARRASREGLRARCLDRLRAVASDDPYVRDLLLKASKA
jgi:hypothetical protein